MSQPNGSRRLAVDHDEVGMTRLYTLLRTFSERKNYARVPQRSAPTHAMKQLGVTSAVQGAGKRRGVEGISRNHLL